MLRSAGIESPGLGPGAQMPTFPFRHRLPRRSSAAAICHADDPAREPTSRVPTPGRNVNGETLVTVARVAGFAKFGCHDAAGRC